MKEVVLILEKEEYKNKEKQIEEISKIHNAKAKIYHTTYENDLIRKVRNWKLIGSLLQHILYWIKAVKYALRIRKDNKDKNIISINPIVGLFLGLWNKNNRNRIILCGFLFEEKKNKLYYTLRKYITKKMLNNIEKVVVYSRKEVNYYEKLFPEFIGKFAFVEYGIDYDIEKEYEGDLPEEYIFSGGGSNRDYKTLLEAYSNGGFNVPLYIATKTSCISNLEIGETKILTDVVLETFGDVLKKSSFMVLSLKDTQVSAGHQVLLQALKHNKIILVNRILAVEDYVSDEQVIFYKSGDITELRNKMKDIIENKQEYMEKYKNNSKFYTDKYTFDKFLNRLFEL